MKKIPQKLGQMQGPNRAVLILGQFAWLTDSRKLLFYTGDPTGIGWLLANYLAYLMHARAVSLPEIGVST